MRTLAVILLGAGAVSCAGTTDAQLSSLQHRQDAVDRQVRVDERRAADLRADVIQQRRRLRLVAACIDYSKCEAKRAALEAQVQAQLALCNEQAAAWQACRANRMNRTAKGAVGLCLVGIGAALLTGGASIAAGCGGGALLGAGGGYVSASGSCTRTSHPPICNGPRIPSEVLGAAGLSAPPVCTPPPVPCAQLTSG